MTLAYRRFEYLHSQIASHIRARPNLLSKNYTSSRKRLAIALYRLATGGSFTTVGAQFGVAGNTCSNITRLVCHAICKHMMAEWVKAPTGEELANNVAGFKGKGFPLCAGAVDGCHIPQAAPRWTNLKDAYYNRKSRFSIQLQVWMH